MNKQVLALVSVAIILAGCPSGSGGSATGMKVTNASEYPLSISVTDCSDTLVASSGDDFILPGDSIFFVLEPGCYEVIGSTGGGFVSFHIRILDVIVEEGTQVQVSVQ